MTTSRMSKSSANAAPGHFAGGLRIVLLGAAALCLTAQGYAESGGPSRSSAPVGARVATETEKAFWVCDYAATTRWVDAEEGAMCVALYEELKKRKFGGDFQLMLDWWRKNKPAEHKSLAAASRTTGAP